MEVQMAARGAKSVGGTTPPHRGGGAKAVVTGYLRPSAGSCHHVCKYGGTHTFEEEPQTHGRALPKPRKQQQQQPPVSDGRNTVLVKVRSVFRRRAAGESSTRVAAGTAGKAREAGGVEWKDIVAYDSVSAQITGSGNGDKNKKDATTKGKKKKKSSECDTDNKAYVITVQQVSGVKGRDRSPEKKPAKTGSLGSKVTTAKVSTEPPQTDKEESASPLDRNSKSDTKSVKPPKGKKPAALLHLHVEKTAMDQDMVHGYQIISPSLVQSRSILLRDLEKEMADEAAAAKQGKEPACPFDQEEYYHAAAAGESSSRPRPVPAHRRVKSMSISSRSTRQGSKASSAAFKVRSRSTRAPAALPCEEEEEEEGEKPVPATAMARLRSRRLGEDPAGSGSVSSAGRGIQLRIRSLRRRGVRGAGFVVPAVALRHQKTLEKKRSQRLYNNLIEETANKLVKSKKSRVKALVGAFESVISRIAK